MKKIVIVLMALSFLTVSELGFAALLKKDVVKDSLFPSMQPRMKS